MTGDCQQGSCRAGSAAATRGWGTALLAMAVLALWPGAVFAGEAPAQAPTPANTGTPVLAGTPLVGNTLTCSNGTWSNNANAFSYAWLRDGQPIPSQTGSSYAIQRADAGHALSCQVTASNSGGEYTIVGLSTGYYEVRFDPGQDNYLFQYFNGQSASLGADPVAVTAPNLTGGIDAMLQTGGQISGQVTAAGSGVPLSGIHVCASATGQSGDCAITGADGQYTISGLPSGSYRVEFERLWIRAESAYLAQYYPGKSSSSEAGLVSVAAGTTTGGVDAALLEGGRITGRVSSASAGMGLGGVEVCAVKQVEGKFETSACQTTDGSGDYAIRGLSSGSYRVEFSPRHEGAYGRAEAGNYLKQYYPNRSYWEEAALVEVSAGREVTGIDAALQTGNEISGTVTSASDGKPLAGILACVEQGSGDCVATEPDGKYLIPGLALGFYRVSFRAPEGENYLTQYYNGTESRWGAEQVSVGSGITYGIDAAMKAGGEIAGRVTDSVTTAPLANVSVCAPLWSYPESHCTRTNASGEYALAGIPAGTYNIEFRVFDSSDHMRQVVKGVAVSLGDTSQLDAAMQPGGAISGRVTAATGGAGIAGIHVCAFERMEMLWSCAETNAAGGAASATSGLLHVRAPNARFRLVVRPVFNSKSRELTLLLRVTDPGTFAWRLSYKSACKRRHGRCAHRYSLFAAGSKSLQPGISEVKIHASTAAVRALLAGRTLKLRGTLRYASAYGGAPWSRAESVTVRLRRHARHRRH